MVFLLGVGSMVKSLSSGSLTPKTTLSIKTLFCTETADPNFFPWKTDLLKTMKKASQSDNNGMKNIENEKVKFRLIFAEFYNSLQQCSKITYRLEFS